MNSTAVSVVHPTDLSDLSINAFAHALKIGLATKCTLYVVHVAERQDENPWRAFPQIRRTLARWGLCDESETPPAEFKKFGIKVAKVEIEPQRPVQGLLRFLAGHPSGLMVLATHGRKGVPRWLQPSIAEAMSRRSAMQTLFIPSHCQGFVDRATGELNLKKILVPVDHSPPPAAAIAAVQHFARALGVGPEIKVLHVGKTAPVLEKRFNSAQRLSLELRTGNIVDGILQAASETAANLICMATAGHNGILDALRGSTTEQVLRRALCPVLAVPVVCMV